MLIGSRRRASLAGGGERPVFVGKTGVTTKTGGSSPTYLYLDSNLTGGIANSPSTGDLVVVGWAVGSRGFSDPPIDYVCRNNNAEIFTIPHTTRLYGNDTNDTSLVLGYRFVTSSHDRIVVISDYGTTGVSHSIQVEVWRGVDTTTPMDVAAVTATGTNTGIPDPGSITPSTLNSEILCFAAGASTDSDPPSGLIASGFTEYTAQQRQGSNSQASIASVFGHYDWVSGAFDPAVFTGGSSSTSNSWAAVLIALRPAS